MCELSVRLSLLLFAIRALCSHLLFQLLTVAQSFSIFSTIKQQDKFLRIYHFFNEFSKFHKHQTFLETIFVLLSIHSPLLVSCEVPQKIWAHSVQPFWCLSVANKQTDKQREFLAYVFLVLTLIIRFPGFSEYSSKSLKISLGLRAV